MQKFVREKTKWRKIRKCLLLQTLWLWKEKNRRVAVIRVLRLRRAKIRFKYVMVQWGMSKITNLANVKNVTFQIVRISSNVHYLKIHVNWKFNFYSNNFKSHTKITKDMFSKEIFRFFSLSFMIFLILCMENINEQQNFAIYHDKRLFKFFFAILVALRWLSSKQKTWKGYYQNQ